MAHNPVLAVENCLIASNGGNGVSSEGTGNSDAFVSNSTIVNNNVGLNNSTAFVNLFTWQTNNLAFNRSSNTSGGIGIMSTY